MKFSEEFFFNYIKKISYKGGFAVFAFFIYLLLYLNAGAQIRLQSIPSQEFNPFSDSIENIIINESKSTLSLIIDFNFSNSNFGVIDSTSKTVSIEPGKNKLYFRISAQALKYFDPDSSYIKLFNTLPPENFHYKISIKTTTQKPLSEKLILISPPVHFNFDNTFVRAFSPDSLMFYWETSHTGFNISKVHYELSLYKNQRSLKREKANLQWSLKSDSIKIKKPYKKTSLSSYSWGVKAYIENIEIASAEKQVIFKPALFNKQEAVLYEDSVDIIKGSGVAQYFPLNQYKDYFSNKQINNIPNPLDVYSFKEPGISLKGTSILEFQYSNRKLYETYLPPSYLRWYLKPEVSIFNIPFSTSLLLSTENSPKYDVNSFNISFNKDQFLNPAKEKMNLDHFKSLEHKKDELNQLDNSFTQYDQLLKKQERLLTQRIPNLGLSDSLFEIKKCLNILDSFASGKIVMDSSVLTDSISKLMNFDSSSRHYDSIINQLIFNYKDIHGDLETYTKLKTSKDSLISKKQEVQAQYQKLLAVDSLRKDNFNYQSVLKDSLSKYTSNNKLVSFLMSVEDFGFGTIYPYYSNLTLNQIAVNGVNLEYQLKKFHFSTIVGAINNKIGFLDQGRIQSKGMLYGGRFGLGAKDNTHIYLTFLHGHRNDSNINYNQNYYLSSSSNTSLVGLHLNYKIGNSMLINGEINKSFNNDSSGINIEGLLNQKDVENMAYEIGLCYHGLLNTRVEASLKTTGLYYTSPGLMFNRKDNRTYNLSVRQSLFSNKISLSGFLRNNIDNFSEKKGNKTSYYSFGLNASTNFKNFPKIIINYAPYFYMVDYLNENDTLMEQIKNSITSVTVIYNKKIKKLNTSSALNFSSFSIYNFVQKSHYDYQNISFSEQLNFKKGYGFSVSTNYVIPQSKSDTTESCFINIEGNFNLFKKVLTAVGVNFIADHLNANNLGYYCRVSLPISKKISFYAKAERIESSLFYNNLSEVQFKNIFEDEFMVSGGLIVNF